MSYILYLRKKLPQKKAKNAMKQTSTWILTLAILYITFNLLIPQLSLAQNNDCAQPFIVCGSGQLSYASEGVGDDDDLNFVPLYIGCIERERNSAWYVIQLNEDTPANEELGFTITPLVPTQDYDLSIFGPFDAANYSAGMHCEQEDLQEPIRCVATNFAASNNGAIGLGNGATDLIDADPEEDGFVAPLTVNPNEVYLILVDVGDELQNDGFTLTWDTKVTDGGWLDCNIDCLLEPIDLEDAPFNGCAGGATFEIPAPTESELTGGIPPFIYTWTREDGTVYAQFVGPDDAAQQGPLTVDPNDFTGTQTLTLTIADVRNCQVSDAVTVNIIPVDAQAVEDAIVIPDPICQGDLVTIDYTGAPAGTFNWDFGTDATPQMLTGTMPEVLWSVAGSQSITLSISDTDCTIPDITIPITVTPKLETPTNVNCTPTPTSVEFSWDTVTDAESYVITYAINGTGNNIVTINDPSETKWLLDTGLSEGDAVSFSIIATATGFCDSEAFDYDPPCPVSSCSLTAGISITNNNCGDNMVVIEATGNAGDGATYTWDFDGGTADPTDTNGTGPFTVTWPNAGDYTIELTVEDGGCSTPTINETVSETALIEPNVNCDQLEQGIITWINDPNVTAYEISIDGAAAETLDPTANQYDLGTIPPPGTNINITLQAFYNNDPNCFAETLQNCSTQACDEINIDWTAKDTYCLAESPVDLSGTTPAGGTFSINSAPIGTELDLTLFDLNTTYTLKYVYVDVNNTACKDSVDIEFSVFDNPTTDFGISAPTICGGDELTVTYLGNASNTATFDWDFGPNATVTPTDLTTIGPYTLVWTDDPGEKTIYLRSVEENGCASTQETPQMVTVVVAPSTIDEANITCTPTETDITISWPPIPGATEYEIADVNGIFGTFATITDLDNPAYTFNSSDLDNNRTISIIVKGDVVCDPAIISYEVCEPLNCDLTVAIDGLPATACTADGLIAITYEPADAAVTSSSTDIINVNSGNAEVSPTAGEHTITIVYIDSDTGCEYEEEYSVEFFETPTANFDVGSSGELCTDQQPAINYIGTNGGNATFEWNFGEDASPATATTENIPTDLTWTSGGEKTITLTVTENDCSDTKNNTLIVGIPLETPQVDCINITETSVTFEWAAITGTDDYELEITIGTDAPETSQVSDTSIDLDNLEPDTEVSISVVALGSPPCGNSEAGTKDCKTTACVDITLDVGLSRTDFCLDDEVIPLVGDPAGGTFTLTGGTLPAEGEVLTELNAINYEPSDDYILTYVYINAQTGCTYEGTKDFVINPIPPSNFSVDKTTVCVGEEVTITFEGDPSEVDEYNWDFGDSGNPKSATGVGPHIVSWGDAATQTISLVTGNNNCPSAEATEAIIVAQPLRNPEITCDKGETTLTFSWDAISGATGYVISANTEPPIQDEVIPDTSIEIDNLTPGTEVTIFVTAQGDPPCGDSQTIENACKLDDCPTVNVAINGLGDSFCKEDEPINLANFGEPSGGVFSIDGNEITELSPALYDADTYTLIYNYTQGACVYETPPQNISIYENPVSDFTVSSTEACVNQEVTFNFTGTAGNAANYTWNFGADANPVSATGQNPGGVNWSGTGTKTITLEVEENGCTHEFSTDISIEEEVPKPDVNCVGTTDNSATFEWDAATGATAYEVTTTINGTTNTEEVTGTNYTVENLLPGDAVEIAVSIISNSPCGNSEADLAICTLDGCPTINPTIQNLPEKICVDGGILTLVGEPSENGTFTLESTGETLVEFDPSAYLPGTYNIIYTISESGGACTGTTSEEITIYELPTVSFDNESEICLSGTASFTFTGTVSSDAVYTWDFGTDATPSIINGPGPYDVSWSAPGPKNISLTIEDNSCTESTTGMITVLEPLATPMIRCGNTEQAAANFEWDPIDGVSEYEVQILSEDGQLVETLTVNTPDYRVIGLSPDTIVSIRVVAISNSPCGNSGTGTANCTTGNCPEVPTNIVDLSNEFCEDDDPVTLIGNPIGGVFTINGNTVVALNPSQYTPGDYTVRYTYFGEFCEYFADTTVTIHPQPTPVFDLGGDICITETANIVLQTSTTADATFEWDFGEDATPATATTRGPHNIIWGTTGEKTVSVKVTEKGCVGEFSNTLTISEPLANPTVNCVDKGQTFALFDWEAIANAEGYEIQVEIDGTVTLIDTLATSILEYQVDGLNPGDITKVTITALSSSPCGNSISDSQTCSLGECPEVDINIIDLPSEFCLDETTSIPLTATPEGGTFTVQGFPDVITEFIPANYAVGSYTIFYNYSEGICEYVEPKTVTIYGLPTPEFTLPDELCLDQTITIFFSGAAGSSATYTWDFGVDAEPATATDVGPHEVTWTSIDAENVTLSIEENGCTAEFSQALNILQSLESVENIVCETTPTSVTFNWDIANNAEEYIITPIIDGVPQAEETVTGTTWTKNDLIGGEEVEIEVTATADGRCNSLTIKGDCKLCDVINYGINGLAENYCDYDDTPVTLTSIPAAAGTFTSNTIDFNASNQFVPSEAGAGEHRVVFNYTDENGCDYEREGTITISPRPSAIFESEDTICIDGKATINYAGEASSNAQFIWDFDGGTAEPGGNYPGPHTVSWSGIGDYQVSLSVIDDGCESNGTFSKTIKVEEEFTIKPVVDCVGSLDSIVFTWEPIPGIDEYELAIAINGLLPIITTTDTFHIEPNLPPNTIVSFKITPIGSIACNNEAVNILCSTCPAVEPVIELNDSYCMDEGIIDITVLDESQTPAVPLTEGVLSTTSNGLTGNQLNLQAAGAGEHTILYEYQFIGENETNGANCLFDTLTTITIYSTPSTDFTISADTVCIGEPFTVTYTGNASENATFDWDFGDATPTQDGTTQSYTLDWTAVGDKTIRLLSVSENGCTSANSQDFEVFVSPVPEAPEMLSCESATENSVTITWNPVVDAIAYIIDPLVTGLPQTPIGVTDTFYIFSNLDPDQVVGGTVRAVGEATCAESAIVAFGPCSPCGEVASINDLPASVCANEAPITITYTPTEGLLEGSGIINASGGTAQFDPQQAGEGTHTITVNYDDPGGNCSYNTSQTVTVQAELLASFNIDRDVCINEVAIFTFDGLGGNLPTFNWTFGEDADPSSMAGAGPHPVSWTTSGSKEITLTVNENGCTADTTVTIEVTEPLATPVFTECNTDLTEITFNWNEVENALRYAIEVQINSEPPILDTITDLSYFENNLQVGDEVILTLTALNNNSCGTSETVTQTCYAANCPDVPVNISLDNTIFCTAGETLALQATPEGGIFTIIGIDQPITSLVPSDYTPGTYTLQYEYQEGVCTYLEPVEITIRQTPESSGIQASEEDICIGENITVNVTNAPPPPNTLIYHWDFDGASPSTATDMGPHDVNWNSAGVKQITLVIENEGCFSDTTFLAINVEDVLPTPVVTCADQRPTSLTFDWEPIDNAINYELDISVNGNTIPLTNSTVTETSYTQGELTDGDEVQLRIRALDGDLRCGNSEWILATCSAVNCPVADFFVPETTCVGESINLNFNGLTFTNETLFNWDFGTDLIQNLTSENYQLTWNTPGIKTITLEMEENGCTSEVSYPIEVIGVSVETPNVLTVTEGESIYLGANVSSSTGSDNWQYVWSPATDLSCTDCLSPLATPTAPTTYTLRAISESGCSETATISVNVEEPVLEALFPSAFSPNNDNVNDFFGLVGSNVAGVELNIFNRWGDKVFTTTNLNESWDGNYNGELSPVGMYYYWARVTFDDETDKLVKGYMMLIR